MTFAEQLKQLPPIDHLSALHLRDQHGHLISSIHNRPGQAGSLAVYAALAAKFGVIDSAAAVQGLALYAEHTEDARRHPGKHPNIDRLLAVLTQGQVYRVELVWVEAGLD